MCLKIDISNNRNKIIIFFFITQIIIFVRFLRIFVFTHFDLSEKVLTTKMMTNYNVIERNNTINVTINDKYVEENICYRI